MNSAYIWIEIELLETLFSLYYWNLNQRIKFKKILWSLRKSHHHTTWQKLLYILLVDESHICYKRSSVTILFAHLKSYNSIIIYNKINIHGNVNQRKIYRVTEHSLALRLLEFFSSNTSEFYSRLSLLRDGGSNN